MNLIAGIGRVVALVVSLASCGGGGGGDSKSIFTAPVDNSVSRIDIAPAAPTSLVSGAIATFTATAFTKTNTSLGSSGISWASSNDAVASVAGGVVTAKLVGSATITATSGGIASAGVAITVTVGAPTAIALRTQPGGAVSGAAFTTQPAIEVRDAAGNLVSTSTTSVTVAVASGGGVLSGTTTVSAASGVATFAGLSMAGTVGQRTLSFSAAGLTTATSIGFSLDAGPPTVLAIRTQPVAATAYAPFPTPAVLEIRDAFGNVTPSTAAVTATIASGGGTIGGTATVNAKAGVATFSSLTINGTAGARTLTFTSGALPAVTSASVTVTAAPPAIIALAPSPATITAIVGTPPAALNISVANSGVFPLTNLRVQSITYSPISPGSWLAATFASGTDAPATLRLAATTTGITPATYTASVVLAGDGTAAPTTTLIVNLVVLPTSNNAYGTTANKVSVVSIGAALSPGLVTTIAGGVVAPDPTVTYSARSSAIATVDATGRITGVAQGQTWIAALSTQSNSDSVLVIVPRSTGIVLKSDITKFEFAVGDTITVRVQIDTRGASLGAVTATVTWPVYTGPTGVFASMSLVDVATTASPLAPAFAIDNSVNVIRINGGSSSGATGVVLLAVVRFRVARSGLTGVYLAATEMLGVDFTNLLPTTTVTQYPIIVP